MIDKDNLGFRAEDGGFLPENEYRKYVKNHQDQYPAEQFVPLEIHLNYKHIYEGKRDDPCLCLLALAIKDALECSECEVWRDQIIIDRQTYETTDEMKKFIDYFDRYGCVDTAARFLGERPEDVFRFPIKQSQLCLKEQEIIEHDLPLSEVLALDGIDLSEFREEEEESHEA